MTVQKTMAKTSWLLMLALIIPGFAFAQTGGISGVVKDTQGGLPAATIYVEGTQNGVVSDIDGAFYLAKVPAGKQQITISYVGYTSKTIDVTVVENQLTNIDDVIIEPISTNIGEVKIMADNARSQVQAYNIQKLSPKVMNVIAADKIGKLPDKNGAEAVQRIVGVTIERDQGEGRFVIIRGAPTWWNSVMLNGERLPTGGGGEGTGRDVPLDVLPANFLQRIEVSKTLTPDMEADAIGGAINYITSTAPSKRILDLDLGLGYHGQSQKTLQNGNLTFGDKLGKFGYMVSGAWYNRNWGSDNYEMVYDVAATQEARDNGIIGKDEAYASRMELRDYTGRRRTAGFNWGAEYEFNPLNKIYMRGMYSDFQDDEVRRQTEYKWTSNDFEQNLTHAIYHTRLAGGDLGGTHKFINGSKLEWKIAYWDNKYDYKSPNEDERKDTTAGYYIAEFEQDDIVYDNLESNGLYLVGPDNYDNIQPGVNAATPINTSQTYFDKAYSYGTLIKEIDKVFKADYTLPVSNTIEIKTGAKVRFKYRNNFRKYAMWTPTEDISLSEFQENWDYNGGFLTEIGSPYDNLTQPTLKIDEADELVKDPRVERTVLRQDGNYEGRENFYAYYAMANIDLTSQLSALVGARYEFIDLSYDGFETTTTVDGDVTKPKSTSSSSGELLPNLQLKYAVNNNMNLRLAATRGMARAEFNRLSPNDEVVIGAGENQVIRGNPDLRPEKTWNFDFIGEYFFEDVGILSGGVFYKKIEDFPNFVSFMEGNTEVMTWENTGNGYLLGFELGVQKRLGFLPGFLNGLGVEANYTYAESEVDQVRDGVELKGRLQNQPKHTANGGIFYEKYGFALRTAVHFKGAYIAEFQGQSTDFDRYYDKNIHMNINASYNITEKIKVYAEASEVLNSPLRYYIGNVNIPEQTEFYSIRAMLGLRMSIF